MNGLLDRAESLVRQFMAGAKNHIPPEPTIEGYPFELRLRLLFEEAYEFVEACGFDVHINTPFGPLPLGVYLQMQQAGRPTFKFIKLREPNMPAMIRELIDLLYVVIGSGISMSIPLTPFFMETHSANMRKAVNGVFIVDEGKVKKPEGWKGPDIEAVLAALLAQHSAWKERQGAR